MLGKKVHLVYSTFVLSVKINLFLPCAAGLVELVHIVNHQQPCSETCDSAVACLNTVMKKHTSNSLRFIPAALGLLFCLLANRAGAALSYWDPEGNLGSYATYTGQVTGFTPPVPGPLAGIWKAALWSRTFPPATVGGAGAPADKGQA